MRIVKYERETVQPTEQKDQKSVKFRSEKSTNTKRPTNRSTHPGMCEKRPADVPSTEIKDLQKPRSTKHDSAQTTQPETKTQVELFGEVLIKLKQTIASKSKHKARPDGGPKPGPSNTAQSGQRAGRGPRSKFSSHGPATGSEPGSKKHQRDRSEEQIHRCKESANKGETTEVDGQTRNGKHAQASNTSEHVLTQK